MKDQTRMCRRARHPQRALVLDSWHPALSATVTGLPGGRKTVLGASRAAQSGDPQGPDQRVGGHTSDIQRRKNLGSRAHAQEDCLSPQGRGLPSYPHPAAQPQWHQMVCPAYTHPTVQKECVTLKGNPQSLHWWQKKGNTVVIQKTSS